MKKNCDKKDALIKLTRLAYLEKNSSKNSNIFGSDTTKVSSSAGTVSDMKKLHEILHIRFTILLFSKIWISSQSYIPLFKVLEHLVVDERVVQILGRLQELARVQFVLNAVLRRETYR